MENPNTKNEHKPDRELVNFITDIKIQYINQTSKVKNTRIQQTPAFSR